MLNLKIFFFYLFIFVIFTGCVVAQPPPSAPKSDVVKVYQEPSLASLSASDKFASSDGKFTISLPNNISGFSALTPQGTGKNVSGSQFQWRFKEGLIVISYYDLLDKDFAVTTEQDYDNYFADATAELTTSLKAKIINQSNLNVGNYKGIKLDFELPNGVKGTYRNFLVNKRQYSLTAALNNDSPEAEKLITQAFDTFSLLSQSTVDEEIRRKIEQSTPPMLPQEPVAKKEKTDAEDDNLKGKVKTVTEESEDLSGTWSIQGRHFDYVTDYNEKGNRLKRLLYDSKANPFEVSVYGYIDGLRASKYKSISFENSPPPIRSISSSNGQEKPKYDTRYSYRYEYKYANGKLAEMQMLHNDGTKGMRYVYNYKGNQLEELVYSDNGKLNQKYISFLDDKGNEIERTNVDVFQSQTDDDKKYSIKYDSFDEKGNWTKKTTSKLVMENGRQIYKPSSVDYRTITYYQ